MTLKDERQMRHWAIFKDRSIFFCSVVFLLGTVGPLFICGCDQLNAGPVVLVVGDQKLTMDVLKQDMAYAIEDLPVSAQDVKEMKSGLLDHVIDRYLMLEYARRHGITVSEDEFQNRLNAIKEGYTESRFERVLLRKAGDPAAWVKRFREQLIIDKVVHSVSEGMAPPDYREIKALFESSPNRFRSPEKIKFRQIFCRSLKKARKLHKRILAGENLAALAREYSEGPEAVNGGEVGWIIKGVLDEESDKTLFSMAPGDISPVTKGPSGYHIFEVISHQPGGFQVFSDVIGHIEEELLAQKRASYCKKWLRDLRSDIRVKINQEAIDKLEFS
jgi:parvulin-like peptidyl-prolyl isomerase